MTEWRQNDGHFALGRSVKHTHKYNTFSTRKFAWGEDFEFLDEKKKKLKLARDPSIHQRKHGGSTLNGRGHWRQKDVRRMPHPVEKREMRNWKNDQHGHKDRARGANEVVWLVDKDEWNCGQSIHIIDIALSSPNLHLAHRKQEWDEAWGKAYLNLICLVVNQTGENIFTRKMRSKTYINFSSIIITKGNKMTT